MTDFDTRLHMTKALRWFGLFASVVLLSVMGVYVIHRLVIMPSFTTLERDEAERNLERCADAISREIYHLDQLCADWASWDDTYAFVQDKNQLFLKTNMNWPTLEENSGLNLLMFYGLDGKKIWGEAYNSSQGGKIDVPEFAADSLGESHYLLRYPGDGSKLTGIMLTGCGPLLISSRPVLKTNGSGPRNATLVMGRFLHPQILQTLAEQTKVPFTAKNLRNDHFLPEENQALDTLRSQKSLIQESGSDQLLGYYLLKDLQGQPAVLLKASFTREIFRRGKMTARIASCSVVFTLAMIVIFLAFWFQMRLLESRREKERVEKLVAERTCQLKEAQDFLATAIAQSSSGILIADAPKVTIRLANATALSIRGGSSNALIGIDMDQHAIQWQMAQPDGAPYPPDKLPLSRAVLRGEITQDEEMLIRDSAGKEHWVSANAAPIRNAAGQITAGILIFHDITARKLAETELQKMHQIKSLGILAGGIAHDFNNVLMALYGNLSLAKDELSPDHPGFAPLDDAEKSMGRAIRLTRQLLTFARGGEPIKEDICIGKLAEDIARFDLTGSNVRLVFKSDANLWHAKADKGQVQQVISNLTINAKEAMPTGGHLFLSLANEELPANAIPELAPGKYIRITVQDEGTGIEPRHLDRIFEPYFSTKQTGSGLGLATTYSIIDRHGGHISVASQVGRGTTFTIHLPASAEPHVAEAPPPDKDRIRPKQTTRILVLDDEEIVRDLVGKMLRKGGFAVETASEGREAVYLYKRELEKGQPFDAVIMDLTIPGGLGGKEAVKELLAIDPNAKAVVSSGYAVDPVMAHYSEYGFKAFVVKPYNQGELMDVLGRVLTEPRDDSE